MNTAKWLRRVAGFLAVAFNLSAGTLNLVAAHKTHQWAHYIALCVNLAAAIFIIALNIKAEFQWRRFERELARLREEGQRLMGIAIEEEMSAKIQAKKNLEKVCNALHAVRLGPCGYNGTDMYEFSLGEITFKLDQYYIYRDFQGKRSTTCYNITGQMPVEEQIASAMLLLARDPRLYVRWSSSPGNYYS